MMEITKTEWQKTLPDYKLVKNGQRYVMKGTKYGATLIPVIVKGMKAPKK